MPREIERKYLVDDRSVLRGLAGVVFRQGYILIQDGIVVRVRTEGTRAVITLKGKSQGIARSEYEYEIPFADAEEMLAELCIRPHIEKTRYTTTWGAKLWEIDVFGGENSGLVLAEIELESEEEEFEVPPWVGVEVSDDLRYYTANLVHHPYARWEDI